MFNNAVVAALFTSAVEEGRQDGAVPFALEGVGRVPSAVHPTRKSFKVAARFVKKDVA